MMISGNVKQFILYEQSGQRGIMLGAFLGGGTYLVHVYGSRNLQLTML